jgi:hypothetical protein
MYNSTDGQVIDYLFMRGFSNQADISERTSAYDNAGTRIPADSVNKLCKLVGVLDELRHRGQLRGSFPSSPRQRHDQI